MITNEFSQPRNMRSNHATGKPGRQYIRCVMRVRQLMWIRFAMKWGRGISALE